VAGNAWSFRLVWLRPLLVLPAAVVNDTFRVLRPSLVGRRRTGGFERLLLSAGAGDDSGAQGRRALATVLISASPGTVVADVEPESGALLLHKLGDSGFGFEEIVSQ